MDLFRKENQLGATLSTLELIIPSFQTHLVVPELPNAQASLSRKRTAVVTWAKKMVNVSLGVEHETFLSTCAQNQAGSLIKFQWCHASMHVKLFFENPPPSKLPRFWMGTFPSHHLTGPSGLLLTTWLTIWYANLACWCAPWSNLSECRTKGTCNDGNGFMEK